MKQFIIITFALFGCAFSLPTPEDTCDCVCGVRGRNNRIVGGQLTAPNEYPWLVGLYRENKLYCGGALISSNHVLSAAHCVHGIDRRHIKIYIGGHNITTDYVDTRRVARVFEHEYFDSVSFDFDIAILELSKPIEFGPKIQPACLPQTQFQDYSGKTGLIAGWGRLGEQTPTSSVLRQVAVPIWTTEQCNNSDYGKKRLTGNMMCAGYPEGKKDACQGDSGGPMTYEHEGGSMELIGVVSWGRGCARPKLPGIYTKVSNFLPWIQKKLGTQCMCKHKKGVRTNFLDSILEQQKNAVDNGGAADDDDNLINNDYEDEYA